MIALYNCLTWSDKRKKKCLKTISRKKDSDNNIKNQREEISAIKKQTLMKHLSRNSHGLTKIQKDVVVFFFLSPSCCNIYAGGGRSELEGKYWEKKEANCNNQKQSILFAL